MLTRIRRRVGRLFPHRWLAVVCVSFVLISVLILRRVKPSEFRFEEIPRILDLQNREVTKYLEPNLQPANVGGGTNWERPTSDEYDRQRQLVTTKHTSFEIDAGIHLLRNDEVVKNTDHMGDSVESRGVNVYIWRGLCCPKVNSLRQYPLFPTLPTQRLLRHTINSGPLGTWYGQRIMGYVHPPRAGSYTFHLEAHVFAEFWLSVKQYTKDVELLAKIAKENDKNSIAKPVGQTSRKVYLEESGKYFFDVLHVMNGGMMRRDHVNLTWKVPGSEEFTEVSDTFLRPLLNDKPSHLIHESSTEQNKLLREPRSTIDNEMNDADAGEDDEDYIGIEIPKRNMKLSDEFSFYFGEDFDIGNQYDRTTFELSDMSDEILSVLTSCFYEPTYTTKRTFKRFEGVWKTRFSSVFPDDGTKEFICIGNKQKKDCQGNNLLTEPEVLALVRMLTTQINEKYSGYEHAVSGNRLFRSPLDFLIHQGLFNTVEGTTTTRGEVQISRGLERVAWDQAP